MYLDLNLGLRSGGNHSAKSDLGAGFHIDGSVGYDFNTKFGMKGDLAFDIFNAKGTGTLKDKNDKSLMTRVSLQGVVSISELAGFGTEKFGLKFHGGLGFATNSNPSFKDSYEKANTNGFKDGGFKGNDDMFTIMFGLMPQYHVNDKISVNLDLSLVLLTGQANYVDRSFDNSIKKSTGSIFNTAVGISYKL
jgi:hypothetical protein